jgi:nitrite reductase/ring-hydroxylating ferredoxin subunit
VFVLQTELTLGAVYERRVGVSLERVWENVHDWEHLPWLHEIAFSAIELEDSGDWGWRARVRPAPPADSETLLIDLRRDADRDVYHTRTLEGPGKGADTVVTLSPENDHSTHVRVEFWLPMEEGEQAQAVGASLVALYTRLWDEDEAMMIRRQQVVDAARVREETGGPPNVGVISLGLWEDLSSRLPLRVSSPAGDYRVVQTDAGFAAHSVLCPHRGGPLGEAEISNGYVVCPWHGYRFALADGRAADGRKCHMRPPPRVERGENGEALLVLSGPSGVPNQAGSSG